MLHEKIEYSNNYHEKQTFKTMWKKCKKYCKNMLVKAVEQALQLYYATKNPECTIKDRVVIYGALFYLISPIDIIPDVLPGGLIDDFGVIVWALHSVSRLINESVKSMANNKLNSWLNR